MICTTIQNKGFEEVLAALEVCGMAEIRLDRCTLTLREIEECFSSDIPLVATCRVEEVMQNEASLNDPSMSPQSRELKAMQIAEKRLSRAIEAGASYVDVEIEVQKQMSKRIRNLAHENGTVFIRSYHDFEGTDSLEALKALVEKCHYHGADIVKIVTTARNEADIERVMSLYEWSAEEYGEGNLIAFCMGEAGKNSRLECLKAGSPYTYAALSEEEAAAPGQWPVEEMKKAVYEDFSFIGKAGNEMPLMKMPVSKSFAQRAIIAAALADGVSHLRGYTPCGDNEAAIQVAINLGAEVERKDNELIIKGISAGSGSLDLTSLHVGESGLLTRMMTPIMAQLCSHPVTFTGEKTLLGRPLTGALEILDAFGAECHQEDSSAESVSVPFTVSGPLNATRAEISGKHGSQLISGLLMALPFSQKNTSLIVREPKSIPYMFITLEVLKKFGIRINNEMLGGRDFLESEGDWSLCTEMIFKVKGGQRYKAADIDLEGDWSAAANFLVAGAVFGKVEIAGLDTTSLQADLSVMDILMDAGAGLSQIDGDKGNIVAYRAPLKAFKVDASNCPDLFPIISVLAAFCQGTSRLAGVGRLANKESDRAKAIIEMLTQMGVEAWLEDDEMVIKGYPLSQRLLGKDGGPSLLKGGSYTSHHDHRMVMALKVAALGADSPVLIDDEACVAKSFPQFHDTFSMLVS